MARTAALSRLRFTRRAVHWTNAITRTPWVRSAWRSRFPPNRCRGNPAQHAGLCSAGVLYRLKEPFLLLGKILSFGTMTLSRVSIAIVASDARRIARPCSMPVYCLSVGLRPTQENENPGVPLFSLSGGCVQNLCNRYLASFSPRS